MSNKHVGKQSIIFAKPVVITEVASVAGPKEGEGPLASGFDIVLEDILSGEESWEKAESALVKSGIDKLLAKAGKNPEDIDYILAGDLLNQSIGTTFGIRDSGIPFFGVFGACSTMGEAMSLGAIFIDGGFASNLIAAASSHFCSAEKQFRYPLELGTQRPLTSSWTVTGSGTALLSSQGQGPCITSVTTGKIIDLGISDVNNMGAAMAPAAADVMLNHFQDMNRGPDYYDVIATGDLGHIGMELTRELLAKHGITLGANYVDCGALIFDKETQDTHAGGSGCGCAGITFCGYFYDKLKKREIKNLLFIPTGALLSPTSAQQGETIPGIAHAVVIEAEK